MDPTATHEIMVASDSDLEERAVAAVDLLVWLAVGGAMPEHRYSRATLADECKGHIFAALDRLDELEGSA